MKRMAIAGAGALVSLSAFGQDLLQCVNPDVINTLLMVSREAPEYTLTPDRPDVLAGFSAPPEFAWIGSRSTAFDVKAAYRTDLEPLAARQAFVAAMQGQGFQVLSEDDSGFVLTSPPLLTSMCRESVVGTIILREVGNARYLTVSFPNQIQPRSCEAMRNQTASVGRRGFDLIPKLITPPEVEISRRPGALPTGSGSGSNDSFTSSIEVQGVDSMSGLASLLSDQIRDQGWSADSSWSGSVSAGSTWMRDDDGTLLAGQLIVRSIGAGYYDLSFTLSSVD